MEKIYGVYPGSLSNVERINNIDEIDLYLKIDGLTKYILDTHKKISHGELPDLNISEDTYALEYMIYQTTRFGVAIPAPEEGKHVPVTASYIDWFTYYTKHFHDNMDDETFKQFLDDKRQGKDVTSYLPEKTWSSIHAGNQLTKKAVTE